MELIKGRSAQPHLRSDGVDQRCKGERGSVLPLLIGFVAITLATVALVINVGFLRSQYLMLVTAAEEVAVAAALGVNTDTGADSLTGEIGERLILDESRVQALARKRALELATGWKRLRLESVVVKSRAVLVRLCVSLRLPLNVGLPGLSKRDSKPDTHTMCASAAAALALSPPQ